MQPSAAEEWKSWQNALADYDRMTVLSEMHRLCWDCYGTGWYADRDPSATREDAEPVQVQCGCGAA